MVKEIKLEEKIKEPLYLRIYISFENLKMKEIVKILCFHILSYLAAFCVYLNLELENLTVPEEIFTYIEAIIMLITLMCIVFGFIITMFNNDFRKEKSMICSFFSIFYKSSYLIIFSILIKDQKSIGDIMLNFYGILTQIIFCMLFAWLTIKLLNSWINKN